MGGLGAFQCCRYQVLTNENKIQNTVIRPLFNFISSTFYKTPPQTAQIPKYCHRSVIDILPGFTALPPDLNQWAGRFLLTTIAVPCCANMNRVFNPCNRQPQPEKLLVTTEKPSQKVKMPVAERAKGWFCIERCAVFSSLLEFWGS